MLTPEIRDAPADWPVSPSSWPARVNTGTTRPDGPAYIVLSPSSTYLLRSGSMEIFYSPIVTIVAIMSYGVDTVSDVNPVPVNPAALPAPRGYSHGTLAGNTLHLGGQTALDAEMRIVPGGIVEQFRQAFGNVLTTLSEVGGRPEDLVSITIFLTDIPDYQAHGREI